MADNLLTPWGTVRTRDNGNIHTQIIDFEKLDTASVVAIPRNAAVATLANINVSRNFLSIYNSSDVRLAFRLGAGASFALFTATLDPDDYWEMPQIKIYRGIVTGIWESAGAGNAMVTEY